MDFEELAPAALRPPGAPQRTRRSPIRPRRRRLEASARAVAPMKAERSVERKVGRVVMEGSIAERATAGKTGLRRKRRRA
jgi:hypothetical protein